MLCTTARSWQPPTFLEGRVQSQNVQVQVLQQMTSDSFWVHLLDSLHLEAYKINILCLGWNVMQPIFRASFERWFHEGLHRRSWWIQEPLTLDQISSQWGEHIKIKWTSSALIFDSTIRYNKHQESRSKPWLLHMAVVSFLSCCSPIFLCFAQLLHDHCAETNIDRHLK